MPFASALSEHPVATHATGEVSGAVLESLGERPDLVVVAATPPHAGAFEDIVSVVASVLRPLAMIGGIAEAVIGVGREAERTPAISVWAARVGPLASLELTADRRPDGSWRFDGWSSEPGFAPSALLLLADPFTFPVSEFLRWLEATSPALPAVGGNLSGGRGPGASRLLLGDRVATSGAAGVLLGPGVEVECLVSQGGLAFGHPFTVTRSDRNVIYEIAGMTALERLADQVRGGLRPSEVSGIGADGLLLGRLVDEHKADPGPGDYLVRSVVGADRDSGAVAVDDHVPVGSTVRFHRRDAETAHGELELVLQSHRLKRHRAEGALLFSCNGRGTRLFGTADHDAAAVRNILGAVPLGGFAAAGEIGPVGGRNFLHGLSASMAFLADR